MQRRTVEASAEFVTRTFKLLSKSNVALTFATDELLLKNRGAQDPVSMVTPRWAECLTAGCVVAGTHSDEAKTLFNWDDALFDLPTPKEHCMLAINALLNDATRISQARSLNVNEMATRHDWRHRVANLFDVIGIQHPTRLQEAINNLSAKFSTVGSDDLQE